MTLLVPDPPTRGRKLMTVVILVIAAGLLIVSFLNQKRRTTEVQQTIADLCRDVGAGKDVTSRLDAMSPVENPLLLTELKRVCLSSAVVAGLQVVVERGDSSGTGTLAGTATHTALIRAGNVDLLGLRIKHEGKKEEMQILGYWVPQGP